MELKLRYLLFFLLFMVCQNSLGISENTLIYARVTVPDRSSEALQLGLKAAFQIACLKQSKNPNVMSLPKVQAAMTNLTQWIQSYSYFEVRSLHKLFLKVSFDRKGLEKLLKEPAAVLQKSVKKQTVEMTVSGIKSADEYVEVIHNLRAIKEIKKISTKELNQNGIALQIELQGNSTDLQQSLANNPNFTVNTDSKTLHTIWKGK